MASVAQPVVLAMPDGSTVEVGVVFGRGASGVVHRGVMHTRGGDEEVAVKMLGAGSSDKAQRSFLREIQKAQSLGANCLGVAITYGSMQHNGQACMVMKLYSGSLAERLERDGALQLKDVLRFAGQIARALKSVHSHGAAVLDLKPANLLFDEDDSLNVADFGISHVADLTMAATATTAGGKGTPVYMPPEQHDPDEHGLPGPASDIWAFACVLLEMITGKIPWAGMRPTQIQMQVAVKGKSPLIPADVPQPIADVLNRCFVTAQEGRISAAELVQLLESVAANPACGGSISFCFSYASAGANRVEEAKAELEARGHFVFYGKDVSATVDADWRKQWCVECSNAQACVNFLSAGYIRSDPCSEEWNFSRSKKEASVIVDLLVGGRDAREKLMAVPIAEVADKGGAAIRMHFVSGGQAVSVYGGDNIADAILGQLITKSEPLKDKAAKLRAKMAHQSQSRIMTVAQLAAAEGVAVAELLMIHDIELDELFQARQMGILQRKKITTEFNATRQAELQIKSAQEFESAGRMNEALAQFQAAEAYFQGSKPTLTVRISVVTAALEAQRLEEEQRRQVEERQEREADAKAQAAAEAYLKEAKDLERQNRLDEALAKYLAADMYFQGSRPTLNARIQSVQQRAMNAELSRNVQQAEARMEDGQELERQGRLNEALSTYRAAASAFGRADHTAQTSQEAIRRCEIGLTRRQDLDLPGTANDAECVAAELQRMGEAAAFRAARRRKVRVKFISLWLALSVLSLVLGMCWLTFTEAVLMEVVASVYVAVLAGCRMNSDSPKPSDSTEMQVMDDFSTQLLGPEDINESHKDADTFLGQCYCWTCCISLVAIAILCWPCPDGHSGARCETVDHCMAAPILDCGKYGTCGDGSCACTAEYGGEHCENYLCDTLHCNQGSFTVHGGSRSQFEGQYLDVGVLCHGLPVFRLNGDGNYTMFASSTMDDANRRWMIGNAEKVLSAAPNCLNIGFLSGKGTCRGSPDQCTS